MDLIADVGAGNVVVHLDSYHVNIEERSMEAAVTACGDRLRWAALLYRTLPPHATAALCGRCGLCTLACRYRARYGTLQAVVLVPSAA